MGDRWENVSSFIEIKNFILPDSCLADPCEAVDGSGCSELLLGLLETSGRVSEAVRQARLKG